MSRSTSKKLPTEPRGVCDRREEILEAATRLFAEHGFSDAVTQLLADELGVGKGTLYRYFPSKRELFLAAADRAMRRLHERMEASIRGIEDPLDRIARAVGAYLAFFAEHPELVELLIQERAQFKDRDKPTYCEHRDRYVERWRTLYRGLIAEGRVREMPVERITDVISAALYGAMFLNHFNSQPGSFAARAEDILDVIFFGILSEPERSRRAAENGSRSAGERTGQAENGSRSAGERTGQAARWGAETSGR
ncbi:MAG: TetR/AcrR family transcriptional regulator [Isosphaeraceae bacterium]|nr:TetR/AcrR family transcriptional regulator [Isosphaeraceae bacterium]